jgi:hypothetical protein
MTYFLLDLFDAYLDDGAPQTMVHLSAQTVMRPCAASRVRRGREASANPRWLGGQVPSRMPLCIHACMYVCICIEALRLAPAAGRIQAGAMTQAVAATFDIHPTLLHLAGLPTPADRVIDGQDLSPILFADYARQGPGSEASAGHACYFFYAYAVAADADNALSAVRCGDHKAYYFTSGDRPPRPYKPGKQATPLVFNLVKDPSESSPVDQSSEEYKSALTRISKARSETLPCAETEPHPFLRQRQTI